MYLKLFFRHLASPQLMLALSVKSIIFLLASCCSLIVESCLLFNIKLFAKIKSTFYKKQEEWKC